MDDFLEWLVTPQGHRIGINQTIINNAKMSKNALVKSSIWRICASYPLSRWRERARVRVVIGVKKIYAGKRRTPSP